MRKTLRLVSLPALAVALTYAGGTVVSAQDGDEPDTSVFDSVEENAQDPNESDTNVFDSVEEEIPRGETVLSRPRPELDALGIRLGGFLFSPKLAVEESYNNNIFSVESGMSDDFITVTSPELVLGSDWNNHELNLTLDASLGRFADYDEENYDDYHAGVDGRIDITRDSHLFAALNSSFLHEGRGSPNDAGGSDPTEFRLNSGALQFFQRLNRLSFTLDGSQRYYDYDDVATSGAPINNDDRDRTDSDLSLRVGYEIVPEYEAFVTLSGNDRAYDDGADDNGFDRDSHGFEIDVGARLDLGGITFGDVFVGYRQQDYEDRGLKNIRSLTFGTGLVWNVTPLTTLNGNIIRTVEETVSSGASGFLATTVGVSADHELLRSLLLNANVGATQNDYEGIGREDMIYNAGFGAKYMLNRYFYTALNYSYLQRDSDINGGGDSDYKQNVISLRLEVQM